MYNIKKVICIDLHNMRETISSHDLSLVHSDNENLKLLKSDGSVDDNYDSIGDVKQLQYTDVNHISSVDTIRCTVFETTCNLVSVLTGSGMLSLPFAAAQIGWMAVPLLLLLGCIFLYSFHLIAQSIETRYKSINASQSSYISYDLSHYQIDYLHLAKLTFGRHGDRIVLVVLSMELFLAQVTFYMNIGMRICMCLCGCMHLMMICLCSDMFDDSYCVIN